MSASSGTSSGELLVALTLSVLVVLWLRSQRPPLPLLSADAQRFRCSVRVGWLQGSPPFGRVAVDRDHLVVEVPGVSRVVLTRREVQEIRLHWSGRCTVGAWGSTKTSFWPGRKGKAALTQAARWGWPVRGV